LLVFPNLHVTHIYKTSHINPMSTRYKGAEKLGGGMCQSRTEEIVARLLSNAANLKYGAVSVCVNLYNGHVVQIVYSTTENTKAPIQKTDEKKEPK